MNRPMWLDPFVLLLQGAVVFCPPITAAFWLAGLITKQYGMSHRSAVGEACLITLLVLLLAAWGMVLMWAAGLRAARQDKQKNKL